MNVSDIKVEPCIDEKEYLTEKVTVSNIPDIGDRTGEKFLDNLERAVGSCRELIAKGFRLTDFWTDPDVGVEFVMKKKKAPGDSCDI